MRKTKRTVSPAKAAKKIYEGLPFVKEPFFYVEMFFVEYRKEWILEEIFYYNDKFEEIMYITFYNTDMRVLTPRAFYYYIFCAGDGPKCSFLYSEL
jgi:hypothetical protein